MFRHGIPPYRAASLIPGMVSGTAAPVTGDSVETGEGRLSPDAFVPMQEVMHGDAELRALLAEHPDAVVVADGEGRELASVALADMIPKKYRT